MAMEEKVMAICIVNIFLFILSSKYGWAIWPKSYHDMSNFISRYDKYHNIVIFALNRVFVISKF